MPTNESRGRFKCLFHVPIQIAIFSISIVCAYVQFALPQNIDRVETTPVNPGTHKAVSGVGIFLTVLAGSTFLGAITTAVAGNTIAAIFALVFTFIWGRLAITAFTEKTLR